MLIYRVQNIPDLTLSKYQVFADTGIDGMLQAQTQFIRQLYRVALLGEISIHFILDYDPERPLGKKLNINLAFSENDENAEYKTKLKKVVNSSDVSKYFYLEEIEKDSKDMRTYPHRCTMRKKERFLQTSINSEEKYFYVVPNWKMREEARLYRLLKLMESFDEPCCYRVDLYAKKGFEEQIHKSFERPLSFLRNISNQDRGISEYSRNHQEKRDPNADETLRQYEDWIKAVDASAVFQCRISSFAQDQQYCQLLLDSTIAECVETGNSSLELDSGSYSIWSDLERVPEGKGTCSPNTPPTMQWWPTTFTAEEIAAFVRFPVLYDGENIELPKETAALQQPDGIVLGKDSNGYPVRVPIEMLPNHMFVFGVPGAGKTNTMLHLANSMWNMKIPFLVLEPAKREYRELAWFDIPELIIFSPSACTDFPLRLNPFEFPKGLTLSEHIGKLCQVFEGAFPIAPPAPFILDRAIQTIYEKHGWNVKDINMGQKEYPVLSELYEQFEKELLTTNYDSEIQGNIRSVLEMRIGSLLRREKKEMFDVKKSTLSPEEWLQHPVIIELEALGEGPANFVTLLLCTLIRETLKVNSNEDKSKTVRHVIFIEEAHNLISQESQVKEGQDSNPKIAATAFIVKMLAEVRALREGIIIADQLPTAMAPEVIKNTNIKLVHRLTAVDDRELVGSTMSASPLQLENMATYTKGHALFTYEDLLRPFDMQVERVGVHGTDTPDDSKLYELMMNPEKHPVFYNLRKKEFESKWDGIKKDVQSLLEKEMKAVKQLIDFNFQNTQYEELEQRVDSCAKILKGFELMKKSLRFQCLLIPDEFIEKQRKEALLEIIDSIGNRYQEKLEKLIVHI